MFKGAPIGLEGAGWLLLEQELRRTSRRAGESACPTLCGNLENKAVLLGFDRRRVQARHLLQIFDGFEIAVLIAIAN
jgi:hypothetical protein